MVDTAARPLGKETGLGKTAAADAVKWLVEKRLLGDLVVGKAGKSLSRYEVLPLPATAT